MADTLQRRFSILPLIFPSHSGAVDSRAVLKKVGCQGVVKVRPGSLSPFACHALLTWAVDVSGFGDASYLQLSKMSDKQQLLVLLIILGGSSLVTVAFECTAVKGYDGCACYEEKNNTKIYVNLLPLKENSSTPR